MSVDKKSIHLSLLIRILLGICMIFIFSFSGCSDTGSLGIEGEEGGLDIEAIQSFDIGRGGTKDITIGIMRRGESTGEVDLLASGFSTDEVTITFDPNPIPPNSNTSNMHIVADSTASLGDHQIFVNGSLGSFNNNSSFTLTVTAGGFDLLDIPNIEIIRGDSTDFTVEIDRDAGFTGDINLSTTPPLTDVTITFNPNPTNTNSSTMHINIGSNALLEQNTISVAGTSGEHTNTSQFLLSVEGFSIDVSNTSPSVEISTSLKDTVTITRTSNFSDPVDLSLEGVPQGVTPIFTPLFDFTILEIFVDQTATAGDYNITLKGTAGSVVESVPMTLTITGSTQIQWVEANTPLITEILTDVYFINEQNGYAVGTLGKIYESNDGGSNWQLSADVGGGGLNAIHSNGATYAVGNKAFRLNGSTWELVEDSIFTGNFQDVYILSSQEVWLAGNLEIYHTTDGGISWESDDPASSGLYTSIWFNNAGNGYIATDNGMIYKKDNGDTTWNQVHSGSGFLFDVTFGGNTGFAVGSPGIILTGDDGWAPQTSPVNDQLNGCSFLSSQIGVIAGGFGTGIILWTEDGGNSWVEEIAGGAPLRGVAILNSVNAVAVGTGVIMRRQ